MTALIWARWHGIALGLLVFACATRCWWHIYRLWRNWPIPRPPCDRRWTQRVTWLAGNAWLTALVGAFIAWRWPQAHATPYFPFKAFSAGVALLSLTFVAATSRRCARLVQDENALRWYRLWLGGLSLAWLGLIGAALAGALGHYTLWP